MTSSPGEWVVGYFQAGGLFKGSTVYVTAARIIANRGPGHVDWKWHVLSALVVTLVTPVIALIPLILGVAIILSITAIIVLLLLKRGRLQRKWPTINYVERGRRRFEAKKGQILSIELKEPRRLRSGFVTITSLSGEPFTFEIKGGRTFGIARNLMIGFEGSKVKLI